MTMAEEKGKDGEQDKEHLRVSVKIGDFQIELDGTHGNVISLMEKPLFDFIKELQKTIGEMPSMTELTPEVATEGEIIPPLGRPATNIEALSLLFKSDWGRKPKPLPQVMNALEANGLYYKTAGVAKALVDLVKRKEIRRLGTRGNYQYVAV
jgi:hypothetical protein